METDAVIRIIETLKRLINNQQNVNVMLTFTDEDGHTLGTIAGHGIDDIRIFSNRLYLLSRVFSAAAIQ